MNGNGGDGGNDPPKRIDEERKTNHDQTATPVNGQRETTREAGNNIDNAQNVPNAPNASSLIMPTRTLPMTLNVSEPTLNMFQAIMTQFIQAVSVAQCINNGQFVIPPVAEPKPATPQATPGCSHWTNEGCASKQGGKEEAKLVKGTSIIIHGSSSDEKAKTNKSYKMLHTDSSEDDSPLPKRKLLEESDDLSSDFDLPASQKSKVMTSTPALRNKYFLRPNNPTDSSSEMDDPPPKRKRTTKAAMQEAVSNFFASKGKGLKKKKDTEAEPEGSKEKGHKKANKDDDPFAGKCSICLDNAINVILSCKHLYCEHCVRKLKKVRKPCPKCNKKFRTWEYVFM